MTTNEHSDMSKKVKCYVNDHRRLIDIDKSYKQLQEDVLKRANELSEEILKTQGHNGGHGTYKRKKDTGVITMFMFIEHDAHPGVLPATMGTMGLFTGVLIVDGIVRQLESHSTALRLAH